MIKCDIKIKRIMFPKDRPIESGDFAIFAGQIIRHKEGDRPDINPIYNTVSLKGIVPQMREGNVFTITFNNPEKNNFGTTYSVVSVCKEFNPENEQELREYLKLICGNVLSGELMKLDNPYKLLKERNSKELLKVKGIGETKLNQIYDKIALYSDNSFAFVKLEPLGLTKNQIRNICMECGSAVSAVDICMKDPYSLVKRVKGIGFKLADEIAMKCGVDPFDNRRIKAAVNYVLETSGESGRSYLYAPQLLEEIKKIVNIEFYLLDTVIKEMVQSKEIFLSDDGMRVALPFYVELERDIAKEIFRLMKADSCIEIPEDWMDVVRAIEEKQGWQHTEEQIRGINMVLQENVVIVSGKAGSGKSTVTNAMSEILSDYDISLCCLSAKASQRLREVTGMEASTIHRLLGLGMNDTDDNGGNILSDIIIIDEASMISGTIFLKLLKSIKDGAKVVILGDDGQLTAIGNCSVFSDLMTSKVVPHIELTKIHRQAEKSAIITKSIDFRNQIPICDKDFTGHMIMGELEDLELYVLEQEELLLQVKKNFMDAFKETCDILEVQIIAALKTRGALSTQNINFEIQRLVNPMTGEYFEGNNSTKIYEGDKVINLKNNYSSKDKNGNKRAVFNGSIGIVKKIEDNKVIIDFVGIGSIVIERDSYCNINLAYAISCHSSQGSQWKKVICAFDMTAYVLLNVELVYTALTRAIEHCSLIINRNALNHAIRTIEQKTKQTLLPNFMCDTIN